MRIYVGMVFQERRIGGASFLLRSLLVLLSNDGWDLALEETHFISCILEAPGHSLEHGWMTTSSGGRHTEREIIDSRQEYDILIPLPTLFLQQPGLKIASCLCFCVCSSCCVT